jgi:N-acetylneuraminic acid mutarotase
MKLSLSSSANSVLRTNLTSGQGSTFGRFGCAKSLVVASIFALLAGLMSPLANAQAVPQSGQWIWMNGSQTPNQSGSYGQVLTPGPGNLPGGRSGATTWTDASGNFWLFGGNGYDANGVYGILNDLWEFNPTSQQWAWMSGSDAFGISTPYVPGVYGNLGQIDPANMPGGRSQAASWIDSSGNLWLFGGLGTYDATTTSVQLNDLWEFSTASNEWTWWGGTDVSPASGTAPTAPPARFAPVSWSDASGSFWLFGGQSASVDGAPGASCPSCFLNDLWQFNPSTKQWTLASGSANGALQAGNYGAEGYDGPGNYLGNRAGSVIWTDSTSEQWVFGGNGIDHYSTLGILNDLWRYNPADQQWAWMTGLYFEGYPASVDNYGAATYWASTSSWGDVEWPTVGATPGGRANATNWIDNDGNLWLFGGTGIDGTKQYGFLNELWEFDIANRQWAWQGGDSHIGANGYTPGIYGSLQTPSVGSIPTGRSGAVSWKDSSGNIWLFGGGATDASNDFLAFNDLWEFQPPVTVPEPTFDLPAGPYTTVQTVNIADTNPDASIYYTTNGQKPTTSANLYSGAITVSSVETIQAIAIVKGFSTSPIASALYTVTPPAPMPLITPATSSYTTAQSVHMSDGLSGAFIYYTLDGTPASTSSTLYRNSFTVSANTTINAIAILPGLYTQSPAATVTITIAPVAVIPQIKPAAGTYYTTQSVTIADVTPGAIIYYTTDGVTTPTASSAVYNGPISVSSTQTVKAVALAPGGTISPVQSSAYTITTAPAAPMPSITPATGTYTTAQSVHMSDSVAGASIYYTTDGTPASTSSTLYRGSFTVSANTPINAIAIKPGYYSASSPASSTITIAPVAVIPQIKPAAGTYYTTQSVTIADVTPGAIIYYTTDGVTTPTASSAVYNGPISVSSTQTVKAVALAPGGTISPVQSSAYTITTAPAAPAPSITPATNTYTTAQGVHMSDSVAGASIYYTLDGTPPSTSSTLYDRSFTVSANTTIKAIAIKPGYYSQSPVATVTITIP